MNYKILEAHVQYNHPHGDYIVSVAFESAPGYWKAYYKQVSEISEESFQEVARIGTKYTKHRARQVFESCRTIEELGRIVYEE